MAITAYSRSFKRELDVSQVKNLFQKIQSDIDFSEFIKVDIECPCCVSVR